MHDTWTRDRRVDGVAEIHLDRATILRTGAVDAFAMPRQSHSFVRMRCPLDRASRLRDDNQRFSRLGTKVAGDVDMEHVSYALFEGIDQASAAIEAIESSGTPRKHCGVVLHKDHLGADNLGLLETDAPEASREGAAIGALLGAGVGAAVMGPAGLISGGALGALYGLVGGALAGSSGPDRRLEKLSKQLAEGRILLVVEAPDLECRDKADAAMRAHGAQVEHKPFF